MTRKILKLGIFIIVVGLILSIVGIFVMGEGDIKKITNFYNEDHLYEEKKYIVEDDNINSLKLKLTNRNIEIKRTKVNNIEIKYFDSEDDKLNLTGEESTLYITDETKSKFFNFFRWRSRECTLIEVKVPLDFELDLFMSTTINGSLNMTDIAIKNIDFTTTNGSVNFNNVIVSEELSSSLTNGNVILSSVQANKMVLITTNGYIKFSKVISNDINGVTTNGTIKLDINGNPDDYNIEAKTTNGKITFNGLSLANGVHQAQAPNKINVKTTNGGITININ